MIRYKYDDTFVWFLLGFAFVGIPLAAITIYFMW